MANQPTPTNLDDREVKRVFIAGPGSERLTIKVMYHPPDGASSQDPPEALQAFIDDLETEAADAMKRP